MHLRRARARLFHIPREFVPDEVCRKPRVLVHPFLRKARLPEYLLRVFVRASAVVGVVIGAAHVPHVAQKGAQGVCPRAVVLYLSDPPQHSKGAARCKRRACRGCDGAFLRPVGIVIRLHSAVCVGHLRRVPRRSPHALLPRPRFLLFLLPRALNLAVRARVRVVKGALAVSRHLRVCVQRPVPLFRRRHVVNQPQRRVLTARKRLFRPLARGKHIEARLCLRPLLLVAHPVYQILRVRAAPLQRGHRCFPALSLFLVVSRTHALPSVSLYVFPCPLISSRCPSVRASSCSGSPACRIAR